MYGKDRIKFLEVSRQYEATVNTFLTAQEERIIYSRNISRLYSYVKSKLNHPGGIPPLQKEDDSFALSDKDKCDLLNQYFASVFTKDDGILPSFPLTIPDKSLDFIDVSYNTVLKCLQKLPFSLHPIFEEWSDSKDLESCFCLSSSYKRTLQFTT